MDRLFSRDDCEHPTSHEGACVKLLHFEPPSYLSHCSSVVSIDQGGAPINTGLPAKPHIRRDRVPTMVPHSGRESSRRAAPLFETMRKHQAG